VLQNMNGQPEQLPLQPPPIMKVQLSDGSVTQATVDVWLAALMETVPEDIRRAWILRTREHIKAIHEQQVKPVPRLILPGQIGQG
jgi:hypothetical protein